MTLLYLTGGLITLALLGYLMVALLKRIFPPLLDRLPRITLSNH